MKQAPYLPVTWASNIAVQAHGDHLLVAGKMPLSDSDIENSGDPYLQYVTSVKSQFAQKRAGKNSPHIRFANALDDERLTAFVREFGPVVPSEVSIQEPPDPEQMTMEEHARRVWYSNVTAVQTLATLRTEQRTYAAALRLMIELKRGRNKSAASAVLPHVSTIADGVRYWPDQCEAERVWRQGQSLGPITWHFDTETRDSFARWKHEMEWQLQFEKTPTPNRDAYSDSDSYLKAFALNRIAFATRPSPDHVGHNVLCRLINTFPTKVEHLHGHPVECLPWFSLRFGIRQALYLILKNEYLGRGGAAVCGNDRCGDFFVRERAGDKFCRPECSQQYRQRQYWFRTGASKRKRRRAKLRSRNKGRVSH